MPLSIIIECSQEAKDKALAAGFTEKTVLVRGEMVRSDDHETRRRIEVKVLRDIQPLQYTLTDFWGAGCGD